MIKRALSVLLLAACALSQCGVVVIISQGVAARQFFDDFNRADSTNLGSNWNEFTAGLAISTNTLVNDVSSAQAEADWVTAVTETNQYCKFKMANPDAGVQQGGCIFRDDGTNHYRIWVDVSGAGNTTRVQRRGAATQNCFGGTQTITDGDWIGMTFTGSGTSRAMKIWDLGATDPDTGAQPNSNVATNWGTAFKCFYWTTSSSCTGVTDTTDCSASITVDPLGLKVGMFLQANTTDHSGADNWEAGDCSLGGC